MPSATMRRGERVGAGHTQSGKESADRPHRQRPVDAQQTQRTDRHRDHETDEHAFDDVKKRHDMVSGETSSARAAKTNVVMAAARIARDMAAAMRGGQFFARASCPPPRVTRTCSVSNLRARRSDYTDRADKRCSPIPSRCPPHRACRRDSRLWENCPPAKIVPTAVEMRPR